MLPYTCLLQPLFSLKHMACHVFTYQIFCREKENENNGNHKAFGVTHKRKNSWNIETNEFK